MITTPRLIAATLVSVACAGLALAQAPLLEPKFGLWEMTTTMNMVNAMAGVDTSKMTPDQKARMDAMMKSMGDRTTVTKSCLKKEDLKDGNFMMQGQDASKCTQKINTNTRTVLDANVVCAGERPMNGQMHIELPTPATMKATMKTQAAGQRAGGPPMQIDIAMSGKWISADCGSEK